eukprot:1158149-Prymnesium_polylepis.2
MRQWGGHARQGGWPRASREQHTGAHAQRAASQPARLEACAVRRAGAQPRTPKTPLFTLSVPPRTYSLHFTPTAEGTRKHGPAPLTSHRRIHTDIQVGRESSFTKLDQRADARAALVS